MSRSVTILLLTALLPGGVAGAGLLDDLNSLGIPADSVSLADTTLVISMQGSLSEGDTLLKRYGGVFYTLLDSIAAGWPVVGLAVDIPGSRLRICREDVLEAAMKAAGGESDEGIATWVLEHTRVFHPSGM